MTEQYPVTLDYFDFAIRHGVLEMRFSPKVPGLVQVVLFPDSDEIEKSSISLGVLRAMVEQLTKMEIAFSQNEQLPSCEFDQA